MATPLDAAIVAAFFMEGLHDAGYEVAFHTYQSSYSQGCISMIEDLAKYAEITWELCQEWVTKGYDFPGVFDYEVSSPFGRWWGQHLIEHGEVPTEKACKDWLKASVEAFFKQGETAHG